MTSMFEQVGVNIPDHDCDVVLVFPSGKQVVIQVRPSNADVNYNGSLDILLPDCKAVTLWENDDMRPAPALNEARPETRRAVQIVTELP